MPTELVDGLLPPGLHCADWDDVVRRFVFTPRRVWLLAGLHDALHELARVGCELIYLDGSFVTDKAVPGDYDLCWDLTRVELARIDPIFLDVKPPRAAQHAKYRGDLLPNITEATSGMPFVDFFQIDKNSGKAKGVLTLDPRRVP